MIKKVISQLLHTQVAELPFSYHIKRSKRKTLCIQIKHSQVHVLAPTAYPKSEIVNFVTTKQNWIIAKLQAQSLREEQRQAMQANPMLLCQGVAKNLIVTKAARFSLQEDQQSIAVAVPNKVATDHTDAYVKNKLGQHFEHQAQVIFPARLIELSKQVNLRPNNLVIKKYKARWGSCNSQGVISLNYLLMMTPAFVMDYVIIHELCHLKHMNHSASFWNLVQKHDPQFKKAKLWLKEHAEQLRALH